MVRFQKLRDYLAKHDLPELRPQNQPARDVATPFAQKSYETIDPIVSFDPAPILGTIDAAVSSENPVPSLKDAHNALSIQEASLADYLTRTTLDPHVCAHAARIARAGDALDEGIGQSLEEAVTKFTDSRSRLAEVFGPSDAAAKRSAADQSFNRAWDLYGLGHERGIEAIISADIPGQLQDYRMEMQRIARIRESIAHLVGTYQATPLDESGLKQVRKLQKQIARRWLLTGPLLKECIQSHYTEGQSELDALAKEMRELREEPAKAQTIKAAYALEVSRMELLTQRLPKSDAPPRDPDKGLQTLAQEDRDLLLKIKSRNPASHLSGPQVYLFALRAQYRALTEQLQEQIPALEKQGALQAVAAPVPYLASPSQLARSLRTPESSGKKSNASYDPHQGILLAKELDQIPLPADTRYHAIDRIVRCQTDASGWAERLAQIGQEARRIAAIADLAPSPYLGQVHDALERFYQGGYLGTVASASDANRRTIEKGLCTLKRYASA